MDMSARACFSVGSKWHLIQKSRFKVLLNHIARHAGEVKNLGFYCEFVAKIFLQPAQKPQKCRWESSCLWLKVQRCVRWLVKETLWTVPRSSCIKHCANYPLSILEHTQILSSTAPSLLLSFSLSVSLSRPLIGPVSSGYVQNTGPE